MDTGLGKFAEISEEVFEDAESKGIKGVFKTGQTLEIRGSRFYIHKIYDEGMVLKILRR
jgi:hypothetical protein